MEKLEVVRQSNLITSGKYEYSAFQLDLLMMLMRELKDSDSPDKEYFVYVKDFKSLTGRRWDYSVLREYTGVLFGRYFELYARENDEDTWTQFNMFQMVKYYEGQGKIGIVFNELARFLFFDLKGGYTEIEVLNQLNLRSMYAKRIYNICCQYLNYRKEYGKDKVFNVDYLKEILDVPSTYKNYNTFRSKVLEIAKIQINGLEDCNLTFDYRESKSRGSKSFDEVTFLIEKRRKNGVSYENLVSNDKLEFIKEVVSYGFNEEFAYEVTSSNTTWKCFGEAYSVGLDKVKKGMLKKDLQRFVRGVYENKIKELSKDV